MTGPIVIKSINALEVVLNRYGIPFQVHWGRRDAKTTKDLWDEIRLKESFLYDVSGHLLKYTRVVCAHVFHFKPGAYIDYLVEHKQIFVDGRERSGHPDSSMSEKVRAGETTHDAICRGFREELDLPEFHFYEMELDRKPSFTCRSYPGIHVFRDRHWFVSMMPDDLFKPEGYIEVQKGVKTIYFKWIRVKKSTCKPYQEFIAAEKIKIGRKK